MKLKINRNTSATTMRKFRIFDNHGTTADRFTLIALWRRNQTNGSEVVLRDLTPELESAAR